MIEDTNLLLEGEEVEFCWSFLETRQYKMFP